MSLNHLLLNNNVSITSNDDFVFLNINGEPHSILFERYENEWKPIPEELSDSNYTKDELELKKLLILKKERALICFINDKYPEPDELKKTIIEIDDIINQLDQPLLNYKHELINLQENIILLYYFKETIFPWLSLTLNALKQISENSEVYFTWDNVWLILKNWNIIQYAHVKRLIESFHKKDFKIWLYPFVQSFPKVYLDGIEKSINIENTFFLDELEKISLNSIDIDVSLFFKKYRSVDHDIREFFNFNNNALWLFPHAYEHIFIDNLKISSFDTNKIDNVIKEIGEILLNPDIVYASPHGDFAIDKLALTYKNKNGYVMTEGRIIKTYHKECEYADKYGKWPVKYKKVAGGYIEYSIIPSIVMNFGEDNFSLKAKTHQSINGEEFRDMPYPGTYTDQNLLKENKNQYYKRKKNEYKESLIKEANRKELKKNKKNMEFSKEFVGSFEKNIITLNFTSNDENFEIVEKLVQLMKIDSKNLNELCFNTKSIKVIHNKYKLNLVSFTLNLRDNNVSIQFNIENKKNIVDDSDFSFLLVIN